MRNGSYTRMKVLIFERKRAINRLKYNNIKERKKFVGSRGMVKEKFMIMDTFFSSCSGTNEDNIISIIFENYETQRGADIVKEMKKIDGYEKVIETKLNILGIKLQKRFLTL